jgi:CRP-like cAMP-binding protein
MAENVRFAEPSAGKLDAGQARGNLFAGLTAKETAEIYALPGLRTKQHGKGETLTGIDQVVDEIGILLSGRLSIAKEDINGNLHLLREVSPSDVYTAEIVCTPTRQSPLNICCKTDAAVMTFPYDAIVNGGSLSDVVRCRLMKNLLEIVANANIRQLYKIDILSKKSLRERVCMYLSIQQKKKSSTLSLSLNREELACYLCVDRSALSRELGRMQKEGLIRFRKNRFQILSVLH